VKFTEQLPIYFARGMILDSYIDNYIGEWNDESGKRLSIKKVDETTALVSFFAASAADSSSLVQGRAHR
jgi:hypothetical protein